MNFIDAVKSIPEIAKCLENGKYLQILAQNGIRGPDSVLNADAVP